MFLDGACFMRGFPPLKLPRQDFATLQPRGKKRQTCRFEVIAPLRCRGLIGNVLPTAAQSPFCRSNTANPAPLTRLFRRIRGLVFAMASVTRIPTVAAPSHRTPLTADEPPLATVAEVGKCGDKPLQPPRSSRDRKRGLVHRRGAGGGVSPLQKTLRMTSRRAQSAVRGSSRRF